MTTRPAGSHALQVLGFGDALELVAAHAASELGRAAVLSLSPLTDPDAVGEQIGRVSAMLSLHDRDAGWRAPDVPDAWEALRSVAAEGFVLSPAQLRLVFRLLEAGADAAQQLRDPDEAPALALLAARLYADEGMARRIDAAVDERGDVRDGASADLRRIRRELERANARIVKELERFARSLPDRVRVPDASVSVRDGRYVIAVRREGRGLVGGLVHDESASGGTLFVEPPIGVELMNRLRELERAEQREIRRILGELTDIVRPVRQALGESLEALTELDSLTARARYARAVGAATPTRIEEGGGRLRIVGGGHPSLFSDDGRPVPFDLELAADERTVVVSGPNTGGKTVLLKSIGLLAALHQAGVVPPVAEGTALPVFDGLFADIGDEQSIEASLSTFSGHLKNLREILERARPGSLVLIDELGSGTDPAEGATLAQAILETLTRRGATTVATTHLGTLKRLAGDEAGVVNASLQFDADQLRPTYQLVKGIPGRSFGLAIARRLGFPEDIVDRAEALLPEAERAAERLLAELEAALSAADAERREAEDLARRERASLVEVEERERTVAERERSAALEAAEQARTLLLEARAEVEAALVEARAAGGDAAGAAAARRRVEAAARRQAERMDDLRQGESAALASEDPLAEGDTVRLRATGALGTVRELRDGGAVVDIGGVRLRVRAADIDRAPPQSPQRRKGAGPSPPAASSVHAAPEVDLRGLRAEEVAARLHPALDAAVVADLRALRIIHGKGDGVLREVVRELLEADRRVRAVRAGVAGEGGTGVTVAELGS
ncbi:MAG: Smr/MutS family protein [Gemmatimonadota bacterium]